MKHRIEEFNLEEISAFIQKVALCSRKKYFTESAWARFAQLRDQVAENPEADSRAWQTQVDLFRDVAQAQHEDRRARGDENSPNAGAQCWKRRVLETLGSRRL